MNNNGITPYNISNNEIQMAFAAILSEYMFFQEKGEENEYSFIIGR